MHEVYFFKSFILLVFVMLIELNVVIEIVLIEKHNFESYFQLFLL